MLLYIYIYPLNGKGHVEEQNLQEKEISHDLIGLSNVDPVFGPKFAKREIAQMVLIVLIAILPLLFPCAPVQIVAKKIIRRNGKSQTLGK